LTAQACRLKEKRIVPCGCEKGVQVEAGNIIERSRFRHKETEVRWIFVRSRCVLNSWYSSGACELTHEMGEPLRTTRRMSTG
jgi:hypothetical protein